MTHKYDASGWGDDWPTQTISCDSPGDYIDYIKTSTWESGGQPSVRGMLVKCKNGNSGMIGGGTIWDPSYGTAPNIKELSSVNGFVTAIGRGGEIIDYISISNATGQSVGGGNPNGGHDMGHFTCPAGQVFTKFDGRWNEGTAKMTHFSVSCGNFTDCSQDVNLFKSECTRACSADTLACYNRKLAFCNNSANASSADCRAFCSVPSNNCSPTAASGPTGNCTYSNWSMCSQTCGQGVQTRSFSGNCTSPILQQPCVEAACPQNPTAPATPPAATISGTTVLLILIIIGVICGGAYYFYKQNSKNKRRRKVVVEESDDTDVDSSGQQDDDGSSTSGESQDGEE